MTTSNLDRRKLLPVSMLLFVCMLLLAGIQPAAAQKDTRTVAIQLINVMSSNHVEPRKINDNYSAIVFKRVLEGLDPEKLFLTHAEVNRLSQHRFKIDDEVNGNGWNFFPLLLTTYKESLIRARQSISTINGSAPVAAFSDTVWCNTDEELTARWAQLLHREQRYLQKQSQGSASSKPESHLLDQCKKIRLRRIAHITDHAFGYENYISTIFLTAISTAFDPHSFYFSPSQMRQLISSLSTQGYFFGFRVREGEHGEIVVSTLMPGGPAWKSGDIHQGDVIESLRWEGKQWTDLTGIGEEEVDQMLEESDGATLELTLRNAGGTRTIVKLRKEKMEDADNLIRTFVLEGERRIGYILLPGFYSSWGDADGAACANDVAKAIVKLKKENIDGLIFDVRYNGGGSLAEAVAMAGIFIDAGPMGVMKDKTGGLITVKDMNRGTIYDGPLLLLVNGISASASEFLAAALQDYNRAIIVGDTTYGKATGQSMLSLEPNKPAIDFSKINMQSSFGFATVTTEKIYRINGKSAQQKGVIPDILIEDRLLTDLEKERDQYGALAHDSVFKKTYYTPFPALPLKQLKHTSDSRRKANVVFAKMETLQHSLGLLRNDYSVGNDDAVLRRYQQIQEELKALQSALEAKASLFNVSPLNSDQKQMSLNEYVDDRNTSWSKNLAQDIVLDEAFSILCEYILTLK